MVYHDRYGSTSGWIRDSTPYARRSPDGSKRRVRRSLAEGLGIPNDPDVFVAFRDARTGLESLRSARELWERGLYVSLDAYGGHVYWEFREIHDGTAGQWARLAARLGERAVPSLEDALRELQLEPVHAPLRAIFADGRVRAVLDGEASPAQVEELERRSRPFWAAAAEATGVLGDRGRSWRRPSRGSRRPWRPRTSPAWIDGTGPLCSAWVALARMGELAPGADVPTTSRAWYDELRLPARWPPACVRPGMDEGGGLDRGDLRSGPAGTAATVGPSRAGPDRGRPPARPVVGPRRREDRHRPQHLGGRRVAGSRPVRRPARLGRRRLDAIEASPRRREVPCGPDAAARLMAAAESAWLQARQPLLRSGGSPPRDRGRARSDRPNRVPKRSV